jgi:RNA polymerase sigma-70 factor (sigma-E family)
MDFEQYAIERLPALVAIARAVCGESMLADDVVQDVLIKMHARWPAVAAAGSVDAYVRRMIVNEFLSWRRKWSRLIPSAQPLLEDVPASGPDPADAGERADLLAEIRTLPPRQRVVIGLRYLLDLSDADIADALGCAESTVRVHAARALATLRVSRSESNSAIAQGGSP